MIHIQRSLPGVQDMSNVSDLSHLSDSEEASQEQMIDVIKQVSYRTQQAAEALADEKQQLMVAESQTGSRCRIRAEDFRAVTRVRKAPERTGRRGGRAYQPYFVLKTEGEALKSRRMN